MSKNSKFMETYRRFESAVKKNGYPSVKDYEEKITNNDFKQGQLRICRIIRNYIEHESEGFVEASDNMIDFLEKETVVLDENELPVRKKMISVKYAIRDTDLVVVAADFMSKRKLDIIPIFDKNDFALTALSNANIVKLIASGDFSKAKKVTVACEQHQFGFFKENTPMSQVEPLIRDHKKIFLILNDKKKVVGWIV